MVKDFDTLMCLRQAIKEKVCGLLSERLVLTHDNTQPHTVALTTSLLANFQLDVFPHPPHSPNLTPSISHHRITICSQESIVSLVVTDSQQMWNCVLRSPRLSLFVGKLVYSRNRKTRYTITIKCSILLVIMQKNIISQRIKCALFGVCLFLVFEIQHQCSYFWNSPRIFIFDVE